LCRSGRRPHATARAPRVSRCHDRRGVASVSAFAGSLVTASLLCAALAIHVRVTAPVAPPPWAVEADPAAAQTEREAARALGRDRRAWIPACAPMYRERLAARLHVLEGQRARTHRDNLVFTVHRGMFSGDAAVTLARDIEMV